MCGTCTNMCPGGVQHDILFMRMRQEMGSRCGRSKEVKAAGAILPKENRLRLVSKAARLGTSSLAQRIIGGMRIGNIPIENFPSPNTKPFATRFRKLSNLPASLPVRWSISPGVPPTTFLSAPDTHPSRC